MICTVGGPAPARTERAGMSNILDNELGRILSADEVAEKFGLDARTVRKYCEALGGVRVGRLYKFPERNLINAIQRRPGLVESPCDEEWEEADEAVQHEARGAKVGSGRKIRQIRAENKHGLFD